MGICLKIADGMKLDGCIPNKVGFFCFRTSSMKPVIFHVKWPNIPETKIEIGTEMSAPVSTLSFPLFVRLLASNNFSQLNVLCKGKILLGG